MPNITSAEYIQSVNGTADIMYEGKPQIVFLGRSNVGKSSVINSLVGRKLARSSKQPGKTVHIDFFLINRSMFFVDLPGYGYARRNEEQRDDFRKMIYWYLIRSEIKHNLVVLIVDANVGVTSLDSESLDLFREYSVNYIIVANKFDKVKSSVKDKQLLSLQRSTGESTLVPYSAHTGLGKKTVLSHIFRSLKK